jgi:hypothetical protein
MVDSWNRRREGRVRTKFEALYSAGRLEGTGVLQDLSYSGAHFEEVSLRPDIGLEIRAYIFIQPVSPLELVGRVVRHSENGFAIEYKVSDPEVQRLVDDVAAIVCPPNQGD